MTMFRSLARRAFLGACFGGSLAILLPAQPASAHDPKPRHGGAIVIAGNYHVELVVKGRAAIKVKVHVIASAT